MLPPSPLPFCESDFALPNLVCPIPAVLDLEEGRVEAGIFYAYAPLNESGAWRLSFLEIRLLSKNAKTPTWPFPSTIIDYFINSFASNSHVYSKRLDGNCLVCAKVTEGTHPLT